MSQRSLWLALDDADLLRQCDVDKYRASGPGGQKRNKTDSAVRLRHGPSSLIVIAEESRSQHENKARAVRRLRAAIALHVREPMDGGRAWTPVSPRHRDYWPAMAVLLDALAMDRGEVRAAAARLGLNTAQFSAALLSDDKVMAEANKIRREAGLRPLRR
jgi:hypothetical protein